MATISISITINATPSVVWEEMRHIDRHVNWMADAVAIEFLSDQREGVGTSFRCTTKIGPFTTVDVMDITSWVDGSEMGVRHRGIVTGTGRFTLSDLGENRTGIRWEERLTFPWWGLGRFGAAVAKPVFLLLWRGNLRRFGRELA